jgi:hypothetical protein
MPFVTKHILELSNRKRLLSKQSTAAQTEDCPLLAKLPVEVLSAVVGLLFKEDGIPLAEAYALSQTNRFFLGLVLESLDKEAVHKSEALELAFFVLEMLSQADVHDFDLSGRAVRRVVKTLVKNRSSSFFKPKFWKCTPEYLKLLVPLSNPYMRFSYKDGCMCLFFGGLELCSMPIRSGDQIEFYEDNKISIHRADKYTVLFSLS